MFVAQVGRARAAADLILDPPHNGECQNRPEAEQQRRWRSVRERKASSGKHHKLALRSIRPECREAVDLAFAGFHVGMFSFVGPMGDFEGFPNSHPLLTLQRWTDPDDL